MPGRVDEMPGMVDEMKRNLRYRRWLFSRTGRILHDFTMEIRHVPKERVYEKD